MRSSQLSPPIERYIFVGGNGRNCSCPEVASATMDFLLLRVQEWFLGLNSRVEQNISQEFELFTSESGWGSDSVFRAHSTDRWFS